MGREIGSVCRFCRREGVKLYLKGERCFSTKCAIEKRKYAPGQHGRLRRGKLTGYGMQLREKQKVKRIYGLLEKQFKKFFNIASRKKGITGETLLQLLERRLDNVVYRMGFALSRPHARQLVRHRHFMVNGKVVDIPSYQVKVGDVIGIKERSRDIAPIQSAVEANKTKVFPKWLEVDLENKTGKILALPSRQDIDYSVEESLIVEFYSR